MTTGQAGWSKRGCSIPLHPSSGPPRQTALPTVCSGPVSGAMLSEAKSPAVAKPSGTFARLLGRRGTRRPEDGRLRDYAWALQNIKTLGYELARLTASTRIPAPPAAPPSAGLKSKLCTQADIESSWVAFWCAECGVKPVYVRKLWEFCYVAQALWDHGMLVPGRSGIGFGCGR